MPTPASISDPDFKGDNFNAHMTGAVGDGIVCGDLTISGGALGTVNSAADAQFTAACVGQSISIAGAGSGGGPLVTTIATYVSATQVTLTLAATAAVTGARGYWGTNDTAAMNAFFSILATQNSHGVIPAGNYIVDTLTDPISSGMHVHGAGRYPGGTRLLSRSGAHVLHQTTIPSYWTLRDISIEGLLSTTAAKVTAGTGSGILIDPVQSIANCQLDTVTIQNMGGHAIDWMLHFNSKFKQIITSNCGLDHWNTTAGNTDIFEGCYARYVRYGTCGYRVHNGLLEMVGCNGVDPGPVVTGVVNTSGTAVTWVSGAVFTASMVGGDIVINGLTKTISAFTDSHHITLTGSAGTLTSVTYTIPNVGSWGIFGDTSGEDGTTGQVIANLRQCNVEGFGAFGIRCKAGSVISVRGGKVECYPAANTGVAPSTPIQLDFTGGNAGILDGVLITADTPNNLAGGYLFISSGVPFQVTGGSVFTIDGSNVPYPVYYDISRSGPIPLTFQSAGLSVGWDGTFHNYSNWTGGIEVINDAYSNLAEVKMTVDIADPQTYCTRLMTRFDNSDSLRMEGFSGKKLFGWANSGGLWSFGYSDDLQFDLSNGNITKIRGVATSWPASQGAASTTLQNDGAGNLSWASAGGGSGVSTFTPVLAFGGSSTGITYSVQAGSVCVNGSMVVARFTVALTSKGSATGAATVSGLPDTSSNLISGGFGIVPGHVTGMSGLTQIAGEIKQNSTTVTLYNIGSSAIASLTDANFSNSTELQITVTYHT